MAGNGDGQAANLQTADGAGQQAQPTKKRSRWGTKEVKPEVKIDYSAAEQPANGHAAEPKDDPEAKRRRKSKVCVRA